MRLLAATLGALLISVSHPALAQDAEPQLVEQQHRGEPQPEMQQPELAQPQSEQAETEPPATPEPQTEQAEIQQPAMPESPAAQVEMQPPVMPEPQTAQTEAQQPAMPEAQTEQAATRSPEMQQPEPRAEQAAVPQPEMPRPQMEQAEMPPPAALEPAMQAAPQDVMLPRDARWTVFVEPSLGTRMDLPSAVFTMADGAAYRGVGRQFKTADGRAAVAIYSKRNNQRDTPASYLRKNFAFPRAAVTYERVTRDFFAVSGVRENMIFYSRCNVSPAGGTLHCFDLQFPATERTAWDAIVTRMSRSLRPLNRS